MLKQNVRDEKKRGGPGRRGGEKDGDRGVTTDETTVFESSRIRKRYIAFWKYLN